MPQNKMTKIERKAEAKEGNRVQGTGRKVSTVGVAMGKNTGSEEYRILK